jgi:hypothetical protein
VDAQDIGRRFEEVAMAKDKPAAEVLTEAEESGPTRKGKGHEEGC